MGYFKLQIDNYVKTIYTIDQESDGNIPEDEFAQLNEMFRNAPHGKVIWCNGDGTYSYVDNPNPPDPDPEIDDAELLDILMGGAE